MQPVLASNRAEGVRRGIGTLHEGALHAQLKEWYRRPGDRLEERVAGYVVDLVRGELLVEIQTGGFAPLRGKLEQLSCRQPVRLLAPVPLVRRIVRLTGEGELLSARRSPRRGRLEDVFSRLVSIPSLLCRPQFELEVDLGDPLGAGERPRLDPRLTDRSQAGDAPLLRDPRGQ